MKTQPDLSIITPSYNQAGYIEETIKSVKNHSTSLDIEHIVVDGNSTDDTTNILSEYEDEYNLRWVSEPDQGQTNAINKGFSMAKGKWIGWQNSDDYYTDHAFEYFNKARKNGNADLIYGDLLIFEEEKNRIKRRYHTRPSPLIQRYLIHSLANQSVFISKELAEEVFPLSLNFDYAMDVEFYWKIITSNPDYIHIRQPLGVVRKHDQTKTHSARGVQVKQANKIAESYYSPYKFESYLPMTIIAYLLRWIYFMLDGRFEAIIYTAKDTVHRFV